MEVFSAVLGKSERLDGNLLYVEFAPSNAELKDICYHGMTYPIAGAIADIVSAAEIVAAHEMFIQVNKRFPGAYTLDAKYA